MAKEVLRVQCSVFSEDQRSEIGDQRSVTDRGHRAKEGFRFQCSVFSKCQRSEVGGQQESEIGGQRSEVRGNQNLRASAENRGQKKSSVFREAQGQG